MSSGTVTISVVVLLVVYGILFTKKIKCPECKKEIKATTYTQLGVSWLCISGSSLIFDIIVGNTIHYTFEFLFLTPVFYYLSSEPKVYCRHCMKGIPFSEENIIK